MNILQIIMMECDTKLPTTIPNYKLFSEGEKNIMRQHVGGLPDEYALKGYDSEEKKVMEEVAQEERPIMFMPRLRRLEPELVSIEPPTLQEELMEQLQKTIRDLRADDLP
jgi:hypothetical protein